MSDSERLVREVSFAVEGDGRTIEARIVPYNTPTEVVDLPEHGGTGVPYVERWLPGAFEKQANAANRVEVYLNFEHEDGLRGIVGHGVALHEADDALYGTFRVHPGADGDKALHMVNEGLLTGLSIEAIPTRTRRTVDGIVERVKARLDKVSLCRGGRVAYQDAQVLAVREAPPEVPEAEPTPEPPPVDLERQGVVDETLRSLGYESLVKREVVTRPWNPAPARFSDEEFEASCLVSRPGDAPPKERCSLPVLEPDGALNANALGQAARRINQIEGVSPQVKAQAARRLVRHYRQASMDPPSALLALAGR